MVSIWMKTVAYVRALDNLGAALLKLDRCPFCGRDGLIMTHNDEYNGPDYARCDSCDGTTRSKFTQDGKIKPCTLSYR
jgi:hypothetical protein